MAKMFYSLEEAAQALGMDEDAVRDMAAKGELQQFRDRDKLMFKREQIDKLATDRGQSQDSGSLPLTPEVSSSDDTDAIQIEADDQESAKEDPKQATGISVFDAGEIELADPMAQTQITNPPATEDEIALESVGSGSGLLDLTRESDDTSLGAELLDEIYPGSESAESGVGLGASGIGGSALGASGIGGSALGASAFGTSSAGSGVFDASMQLEPSGSGLENMQAQPATAMPVMPISDAADEADPAGAGMGGGFLIGAFAALLIAAFAIVPFVLGKPDSLSGALIEDGSPTMLYLVCGVVLVLSIIMGAVGFIVGRMRA
jgi:hypothetical protein